MVRDKFNKILQDTVDRCMSVMLSKGDEYAPTNPFHNFEVAGTLQNITSKQALMGMLSKHTVSVFDMACSGQKFTNAQWDEKICDHINYLLILRAMVDDELRPVDFSFYQEVGK